MIEPHHRRNLANHLRRALAHQEHTEETYLKHKAARWTVDELRSDIFSCEDAAYELQRALRDFLR